MSSHKILIIFAPLGKLKEAKLMTKDLLILTKNPLEEIIKKVQDLCTDIIPGAVPYSNYFVILDKDNIKRTLFLSQNDFDKSVPEISIKQDFRDVLYVYGKNVLKDDVEQYFSYYMALFGYGDTYLANKFLCRLDDVNISINVPYIIVFDQIKDQVIASNYELDWYDNEENYCVPLAEGWEEREEEIF